MHEFKGATLKYICQMIKNIRRSFASKVEGAEIYERILSETAWYRFSVVIVWKVLAEGHRRVVFFLEFASNDDIFTPGGRIFLTVEERQRVYDFWKLYSEVSVHRSNDHHSVKINLENVRPQVEDLEDDNISLINTKRGEKKQAHKRVTTNVIRLSIKIISKFMVLKILMVASSTWNHFKSQGQPIKKLKCVCAESV